MQFPQGSVASGDTILEPHPRYQAGGDSFGMFSLEPSCVERLKVRFAATRRQEP